MYLTRIEIPLSNSTMRAALRDAQSMHTILTGLYGSQRKAADLLYRYKVTGSIIQIYAYSSIPVLKSELPAQAKVTERDVSLWMMQMTEGRACNFDLLTMPSKKVHAESKNSQRRVLRTYEERLEWLNKKADQNGFTITGVQENSGDAIYVSHPAEKGGKMAMSTYRYTGSLIITDTDLFQKAMREGLGAGKAYGLGMLLLK